MATPTFDIGEDATATFAAYTWLQNKVDDGTTVAESEVDEVVGAVWANGVDEALVQINEVFQGARDIDALDIIGNLDVGGNLDVEGAITLDGITFDANTNLITWTGGGALRGGAADTVEVRNNANNAYGAFRAAAGTFSSLSVSGTSALNGGVTFDANTDLITWTSGGAIRAGAADTIEVRNNANSAYGSFQAGAGTFSSLSVSGTSALNGGITFDGASDALVWSSGGAIRSGAADRIDIRNGANSAEGDIRYANGVATGRIGTGGFSPGSTQVAFISGTDAGHVEMRVTNVTTTSTNKSFRLTTYPYDSSQAGVTMLAVSALAASNTVQFGGGTSANQAATRLEFLTASAVNTTTGTVRFAITSSGHMEALADASYNIGSTTARLAGLYTGGITRGHRALASDGALTLATTDHFIAVTTTSGAKAATMTTAGMGTGQSIKVLCIAASGGSYTLAATQGGTSGTVTLDAVNEGVELIYTGSIWRVVALLGTATFA